MKHYFLIFVINPRHHVMGACGMADLTAELLVRTYMHMLVES